MLLSITGVHDRSPVTTKHEKSSCATNLFPMSYGSFDKRADRPENQRSRTEPPPLEPKQGVTIVTAILPYMTEDCRSASAQCESRMAGSWRVSRILIVQTWQGQTDGKNRANIHR
jgi:hypothetical protein